MNKVILMGRLVRDPDVKYKQGQSQIAVARFTLAVDRRYKNENEQSADFISCIAFGKIGEFAEKYLNKGIKIVIDGHWKTGSYTNKDGQKVYTNDCIVENIDFAESKKAENTQATNESGFMTLPDDIDENELPFN